YDLTEKNASQFNEDNPNDPDVFYQSWAGVSSVVPDPFLPHTCVPNPLDVEACHSDSGAKLVWHAPRADCMHARLVPAAVFVAEGVNPNDGAVRVSSAKWGKFRGCYPADHGDEIGEYSDEALNKHTGWDYVRFYRNVAYGL